MDTATTTAATEILYWISQYGYLALLPLFILEGPVVGLASGVLVALGALEPLPVFFIFVFGTLVSDTILFFLARDGQRYLEKFPPSRFAFGRVRKVALEADEKWKRRFCNNYFSLMVISRLAPINLVSEFVVLVAGILKIPVKKFYAPILIAQPIWSAAIIGAGYYFGEVLVNPDNVLLHITITVFGVVVLAGLYYRYVHEKIIHGPAGKIFGSNEGSDVIMPED